MHYLLSFFIMFISTVAFADDAKFKGDCIKSGGKLIYNHGWFCVKK